MDRSLVDPDKNETCSRGLHFCSFDYISHFETQNSRVIIVKINPRDVVSIPVDYNNTKGRCCEYTVLTEVQRPTKQSLPPLVAYNETSDETVEDVNDYNDSEYDEYDIYAEDDEIEFEVKEYHKPEPIVTKEPTVEVKEPEQSKKLIMSSIDGTFIESFDTVREAAMKYGIDPDNIRRVCRGKRVTTGGYKWKFE